MRVKFTYILLSALVSWLGALGQVTNTGQTLHLDENSLFFIPENYTHDDGAISGSGTLELKGNWINNSAKEVFSSNAANTVILNGPNQYINGLKTSFPNLKLAGNGNKNLNADAAVKGTLDLSDKVLNASNYTVSVLNPDINAVKRTSGFINTDEKGLFARNTNSAGPYLFPLGSIKHNPAFSEFNSNDVNPLYRPAVFEPENADQNTYAASLINQDPDFLYSRSQRNQDIEKISDKYFYLLSQTSGSSKSKVSFYQNKAIDNNTSIVSWSFANSKWDKVLTSEAGGFFEDRLDKGLSFSFPAGMSNLPVSFAAIPFVFYNAFSPDGDGTNDTWQIKNIDMYPDNNLTVFNRWGDEVFRTRSYSPSNAWTGGSLQSGTYFYVLKVNIEGQTKTFKGFITMVKKN